MTPTLSQLRAVLLVACVAHLGCSGHDAQLEAHADKFRSLASSARAIGDAWLNGSTSGTYTTTALEQTFFLVEQERTALASAPDALLDPTAADLSTGAERLSRLLAKMGSDVGAHDADAIRRDMILIPFLEREQR